MMEILLPMIRADFALVESYRGAMPGPLSCPVTAFAGTHDAHVAQAGAKAWELYASGSFRLVPIAGHHFYLDVAADVLLEEIGRDLADPGTSSARR
jgi:medium-chain acyl-[acyl-carrier-protein] hydrolase